MIDKSLRNLERFQDPIRLKLLQRRLGQSVYVQEYPRPIKVFNDTELLIDISKNRHIGGNGDKEGVGFGGGTGWGYGKAYGDGDGDGYRSGDGGGHGYGEGYGEEEGWGHGFGCGDGYGSESGGSEFLWTKLKEKI